MTQPRFHQRRPLSVTSFLQRLFLGLCAISLLVFIAMAFSNFPQEDDLSSTDSSRAVSISDIIDASTVEIKYSYVSDNLNNSSPQSPDATTKVARYAAFERTPNNSTWKPLTIQHWAKYLSQDTHSAKQHRQQFINLLATSTPHMKAYAFETKGATYTTAATKQFEFVLVDSLSLYTFAEGNPDPITFQQHLQCIPASAPGCVFPNLGNDALLIAPRPLLDSTAAAGGKVDNGVYSHLAAFVRNGPSGQVNEFWRLVAEEYWKVLKERQVWLSTAGGGVAWLHVRLGKKPKYYRYGEFRSEI